ncbi:hypothetical protein ARMGADRAFT_1085581 [Armillaria gallica]|uniref:Uncharacterized protein n=1 Tax=Armillaria gallica TaxID=47427 RepID=A0A2H3DJE9_ARMGA|nr:hypothetical protein ARMGADRAFT_1085581 [Armillaria gallica]
MLSSQMKDEATDAAVKQLRAALGGSISMQGIIDADDRICFVPLWIIPSSFGALATKLFWVQFCIQGVWGVMPIQLAEMSSRALYATFAGVAYQLGNMVSSASVQIEAAGGRHHWTTITHENGGRFRLHSGPEKHGPYFKKSSPLPSSNAIADDFDGHRRAGPPQRRNSSMNEKALIQQKESVNL